MNRYFPRIIDDVLAFKLRSKGAVLIEGIKGCGKSTSCYRQANSAIMMQDTETREQNIALAYTAASILLDKQPPLLIDEWQEAPILWDAVRAEVDKRDSFGQFILTGSVSPLDDKAKEEIHHSGIGRITTMTIKPMSLYESKDSEGSVSLKDLFEGKPVAYVSSKSLHDYAYYLCRGGWPKAIGVDKDVALEQAYDYYEQLVKTDFAKALDGDYSQEILCSASFAPMQGTSVLPRRKR